MLSLVAARDVTGGSLGMTHQHDRPRPGMRCSFPTRPRSTDRARACGSAGSRSGDWVDRGIGREALDAISEDEEAAAVDRHQRDAREDAGHDDQRRPDRARRRRLRAIYACISTRRRSPASRSRCRSCSRAIAGGMYDASGTDGRRAPDASSLNESLRVWFGTSFIGAANTIYGILLDPVHHLHAAEASSARCGEAGRARRDGQQRRRSSHADTGLITREPAAIWRVDCDARPKVAAPDGSSLPASRPRQCSPRGIRDLRMQESSLEGAPTGSIARGQQSERERASEIGHPRPCRTMAWGDREEIDSTTSILKTGDPKWLVSG